MRSLTVKGLSRNAMLTLAAILFTAPVAMAGDDSKTTYWFENGNQVEWQIASKLLVLYTEDGITWADKNFPDYIESIDQGQDQKSYISIQFSGRATTEEIRNYTNALTETYPDARLMHALVNPVVGDNQSKHLFIDDRVLVTFSREMTSGDVTSFADEHGLEWLNAGIENIPDFTPTYIFRAVTSIEKHGAQIAAALYESNPEMIVTAQPNRVNMYVPNSSLNDQHIDQAWHVNNSGQNVFCSNKPGNADADVDALNAWNAGYTGQGIKVGVIDFDGFDYDHPDFGGKFLPGWDCINNTSYDATNYYYTSDYAHGMAVCGIIAAKGNNGEGAAGVAHGATIVPLLVDGSEASIIIAIQKALENNVDVVNMSWGSYNQSSTLKTQINNLITSGRNGKGVVVIASHGNDAYNDQEQPQYPAAFDEVISVGASTPNDGLKVKTDNWNTSSNWGSNYGANLDLVAPGVCIFTTDLSGSAGYGSNDYIGFNKTSAAAPVVAGAAAILLSKNQHLTYSDVEAALTTNADKEGSYNYNYDGTKPGHSLEMGYGRVNAMKALGEVSVGIDPLDLTDMEFGVNWLAGNHLAIELNGADNQSDFELKIIDMSGAVVVQQAIRPFEESDFVKVSDLAPGLYIAKLADKSRGKIYTDKFVKMH